jgi:endonuclease/exonuclease/phosphatase family metal-dependent hydrolase
VPSVRVGTFNVENLFARFRFEERSAEEAKQDTALGWTIEDGSFQGFTGEERELTEQAIKATRADVLALQEVESLDTLKRFRTQYLGSLDLYPYAFLVDGNDTRRIDVAVLSQLPILEIRSHQYLRHEGEWLFSRDCLEVDIDAGGSELTLFVNHLRSMYDRSDPANGRRNSHERRKLQAQTVRQLAENRFGPDAGEHPFVVLGDLNDYLETDEQGDTAIAELVRWDAVENVVERMPESERWTHSYRGAEHQLDYLLPSKSLADRSDAVPEITRDGLPQAVAAYDGHRFIDDIADLKDRLLQDLIATGRVPEDATEIPASILREIGASDHCALVMELEV